jgi:hypothetical protein
MRAGFVFFFSRQPAYHALSPAGSKIVELNWRDNPFFPKILNARLYDLANWPDQYDWVWNGGIRTVVEGAYALRRALKLPPCMRRPSTLTLTGRRHTVQKSC